jgi:hypothetical protein
MAVHNFHVQRILTMPAEANPPLIVHADAVLPLANRWAIQARGMVVSARNRWAKGTFS